MAYELLDVGSCGLKIFSRVELVGMLGEELADGSGHGKTQIRIDIDLADGKLSRVAELLFRYADSAGHVAAEFVYHIDVILRNGGRAVKNYREAGKPSGNFF